MKCEKNDLCGAGEQSERKRKRKREKERERERKRQRKKERKFYRKTIVSYLWGGIKTMQELLPNHLFHACYLNS